MDKNKQINKVKFENREVSKYDFIICPNCGEEEVGKFCPNCGQSNKDFNKPVKEILADLLDSINIDIRLLNTLIPFFTRPGFLTQEYFKGRRKRYVPPMRMYMFFSILFFFLVQNTEFNKNEEDTNALIVDSLEHANSGKGQKAINKYFNIDSQHIETEETDTSADRLITLDNFTEKDQKAIEKQMANDSVPEVASKIFKGAFNASEKKELFLSKFLKNLSYALFLLMPFFALILAMILWKSKMLYIKHLIFSINFHSFIFGISSIIIVLNRILPENFYGIAGYIYWTIPVYLMIGIKRFYDRKYVGAFFKMVGALAIYSFILSIVVIAILAFTAQGFSE